MIARFRPHLLVAVALAMTVALAMQPPIPQDPDYHRFADGRTLLGIANFWNVVSNLPFLLVGMGGLRWVRTGLHDLPGPLRQAHLVLFLGVALVGVGSSWYHWAPSNDSLLWDRLPMTLAFMALFTIILGEHINRRLGGLLWPLLLLGVMSVLYWRVTELAGRGDLRPYALVQFLPVLLIPMILLLYPKPHVGWIWIGLLGYVLAKLLEHFDAPVYAALGAISGHSLKHLAAAGAMWALLLGLRRRTAGAAAISKT